jgi:DNA helicase HerA-like ATPase
MTMAEPLIIAKSNGKDLSILPALANRHGLITGATGTGKTVTLQKMAESFSKEGVPVFLADIKGDLTGIGVEGELSPKLQARLESIGVTDWQPTASPIVLWDVFGEKGHPVRATITDMGPLLLGRLLNLNEIQSGILQLVFKIADDNGMLLLDMKDLRTMVQFVGDNAKKFTTEYGNISTASIGAIQRGLLTLEQQGAEHFFGEPILDINDLMHFNIHGQGVVNILSAQKLYNYPKLYSVFLLWLLSELFEQLPEVGDMEKPKLVFFFDEAHLLFNDVPDALLQKIEQVVRLIRSKGVGVYFVTQNPTDIPDSVLGQLGNRVQHALRAFTPRDQKAVKAAAQTMRANPAFDAERAITELGVGEALISFLDEKGSPSVVERGFVIAPGSRMGPMSDDQVNDAINHSSIYGKYEDAIDRESAYEIIKAGFTLKDDSAPQKADKDQQSQSESGGFLDSLSSLIFGSKGPRGGQKDGLVQTASKTVTRQIANQIGRQIFRGILGGISGGRKR